MKKTIITVSFCAALGCAMLPSCSKSKDSKDQSSTRQNAVLQSGRNATRDEIRNTSADDWFDRVGEKEAALGYAPNTSLNALIKKAGESDSNREEIIQKATEIIDNSSQNSFKRWQCCYVLSGIGDKHGIPAIAQALKDENATVRGVAACALGQFDDPSAKDALIKAAKTEKTPDVQAWIQKALDGQFLPKKQ